MDKGFVSVEAHEAVLADLLQAIGKHAGVEVKIHSGGTDRVTQSFTGVGLDKNAIRLLAEGKDVVLVYSSARNLAGTNLAEVRVFAASAPGGRVVVDGGQSARPQPAERAREVQPPGRAERGGRRMQPTYALVSQLADADVVRTPGGRQRPLPPAGRASRGAAEDGRRRSGPRSARLCTGRAREPARRGLRRDHVTGAPTRSRGERPSDSRQHAAHDANRERAFGRSRTPSPTSTQPSAKPPRTLSASGRAAEARTDQRP